MTISRRKKAPNRGYTLLLSTSRVLKSAQYHRQHYRLQSFEQLRALYMHNLDDKNPIRTGFEPSSSEFRATAGSNEPAWPARYKKRVESGRPSLKSVLFITLSIYYHVSKLCAYCIICIAFYNVSCWFF